LIHRLRAMGPLEIARRVSLRVSDRWRWKITAAEASLVARRGHLHRLVSRPLFAEESLAGQADLECCREVIDTAREIVAGRIPLFGRLLDCGPAVDWFEDPLGSGNAAGKKRLPAWSERYGQVGFDVRSIWELNRLQFVTVLARAWQLTGDEDFSRAAVNYLISWHEANPYGRTINWTNALEVALRSLSIVTALNCLRKARACRGRRFRQAMARLLFLHAEYVEGHLSSPSSGFNHLAGETAALAVLGSALPTMPQARKWFATGSGRFNRLIGELILEDGGGLEGSLHYLALVCRLAVFSDLVCGRLGRKFLGGPARERLRSAYEFLAEATDGGGSISELGDSDDSWLPGPAPSDSRRRYGAGLNLLWLAQDGQELLHEFSPDPDSLWLFGGERARGKAAPAQRVKPSAVRRFDSSGHYVLRPSAEVYLRFECGHWGDGRTWGHAHADRLSFSLFVAGRPIFIDPGTGFYLSDRAFREYFRSTPAHNTLAVDGDSQSDALAAFLWGDPIESYLTTLEEEPDRIVIEGEQTGYRHGCRWRMGVVHRRRITAWREIPRLEIEDGVQTIVSHEVCLNFHLHPSCEIAAGGGETEPVQILSGPVRLKLVPDGRLVTSLHRGQEEPRLGWYSPAFRQAVPTYQIRCRTGTDSDLTLHTTIEWEAT